MYVYIYTLIGPVKIIYIFIFFNHKKVKGNGITSNATRTLGTIRRRAIAGGSIPVQANDISWSYRRRGRVARNHTNPKHPAQAFRASTRDEIDSGVELINSSGIPQPPRNRVAERVLISTIEQYSPRKNSTKGIALCSVINPATSSDSASGRSNGVRFVSASTEIINSINSGARGTQNQIGACASTIAV